MSEPSSSDPSPTTTIYRVLLTIAISLVLALVLDARSVVHAGAGMPDGPARTVTLSVGRGVLQLAEVTHLTWPRDELDAALGHRQQPVVPPLLASAPSDKESAGVRGAPSFSPVADVATATPEMQTHAEPPTAAPSPTAWPSAAPTAPPAASATAEPASAAARSPAPPSDDPPGPAATPSPRPAPASPTPKPTALPMLRQPTVAQPLRLLVTGDSLSGYLGPILVDAAAAVGPVQGFVDTHNGTGLTRPDYVDWSIVAKQQVAKDAPDAVVVFLGGNDFQNMTVPGDQVLQAGTPAWTAEYQRRAAVCMGIWAQGGTRRVYWLSMPPARTPVWAKIDGQINVALQHAAAQVPGAAFLDVLGPVTDHGKYADFVKDASGRPVLVRAADGVHLNVAGSTIVANEVLPVIERDWRLGAAGATPTPRPS